MLSGNFFNFGTNGWKDELIGFWCLKVKGHCDLAKLGRNASIHTLIVTKFKMSHRIK